MESTLQKINYILNLNPIKPLLFLLLLLTSISADAQNLVADPGFEIHNDTCSNNWSGLTYWYNPSTATPDLTCTPEGSCNQSLTESFIEQTQFPLPHEGNCMMGMYWCYHQQSTQTREYIATKLITPLVANTEYTLSFFVSRAIIWNLAIDKVGAYFSGDSILVDYYTIMEVEPQIETSGEVLTPDLQWQEISLNYVAEGGEQYMALGNFREYSEMTVVNTGTSWKNWDNAYYFLDKVTLQSAESVGVVDASQVFHEANPVGAELYLSSNVPTKYKVHDLLGRLFVQGQMPPGSLHVSIKELSSGIYVVTMQNNEHVHIKKFWKE